MPAPEERCYTEYSTGEFMIEWKDKRSGPRPRITAAEAAEIIQLKSEGLYPVEIAARMNRSVTSIYEVIKKSKQDRIKKNHLRGFFNRNITPRSE